MNVTKCFEPMYRPDKNHIVLNAGRYSAKSYNASLLAALWADKYRDDDVIVFRATTESLGDSVFNEMAEKLDLLDISYKSKTSPHHIVTEYGNEIYFRGIDGSINRTKGLKPKRKVSVVIIEEAEELRSELHLKNAVTSALRHIDTSVDWKIIYVGNNMPTKTHWWNKWVQKHSRAKEYTVISPTYKDILRYIPEPIVDTIELDFKISPQLARYTYLNIVDDLQGSAYPSFRRDKHLITPDEAERIFYGETIDVIIWGGDGAITHDMTAIVPIAVMSSGRACILERFIYDPISAGVVLPPSELASMIERYVSDMDRKYQFRENEIASYFVIDSASADLITQLRYTLDTWHEVKSYTTKNILRNNAAVNNCFARNMCYIVDYGGYYDYRANRFVETDADVLCGQFESVVWKGTKYDPSVPNDVSDAATYGLATYYENPENLYLPERLQYYEEEKKK